MSPSHVNTDNGKHINSNLLLSFIAIYTIRGTTFLQFNLSLTQVFAIEMEGHTAANVHVLAVLR